MRERQGAAEEDDRDAVREGERRDEAPLDRGSVMASEHDDYAAEATRLTAAATVAADAAQQSLSRADLRAAVVVLQDAAAMHQRATWSAAKGSETARHHHAETERMNSRARELHKLMPKRP
jgi:hypothetical protein